MIWHVLRSPRYKCCSQGRLCGPETNTSVWRSHWLFHLTTPSSFETLACQRQDKVRHRLRHQATSSSKRGSRIEPAKRCQTFSTTHSKLAGCSSESDRYMAYWQNRGTRRKAMICIPNGRDVQQNCTHMHCNLNMCINETIAEMKTKLHTCTATST